VHLGLVVSEVAHDYQPAVTKYVTDELDCLNSYDTWHGMSIHKLQFFYWASNTQGQKM